MVELADKVDEPDEIILAIQSLREARELSSEIGSRNEKLLIDLDKKLERFSAVSYTHLTLPTKA